MMKERSLVCLMVFAILGLAASSGGAGEIRPMPNQQEGVYVAHDFRFESGETLPELRLGYTTLGVPQRDAGGNITNAVLLLHGTTGTGRTGWRRPWPRRCFEKDSRWMRVSTI